MTLRFTKLIAVLAVLSLARFASAALIAPNFTMTMKVGESSSYPVIPDSVTPVEIDGKTKFRVQGAYVRNGYNMTLDFIIDPDPSLVGGINVKNETATTAIYEFSFNMPVSPGFNPSRLSGSVGVTATADATAGAVSTVSPTSLYTALIDSNPVQTLMNHPFAVNVFANDTNTASERFGIPVPIVGGAVNTDIGIKLKFSVTPGDAAGITANFTANPVPEPAAMLGLVMAGLGLMRRSRRS